MKKIVFILSLCMLVVTGCSKSEEVTKTEVQLKAEIKAELEAEQKQKTDEVDERLKDFAAIKTYLSGDEVFNVAYEEMQGEPLNFDHYKLHHIDFNKDGVLDTVMNTWSRESDYRTVVFVTLKGDDYQYYISNLRASYESKFDVEDGFIIEESHGYRKLAYLLEIPEVPESSIIRNTGTSYKVPEIIENSNEYNSDMKFETVFSLKKIDGLKEFEDEIKSIYYDENSKEHLVKHTIWHKKFSEETMEYETTEKNIVEDITSKTMSENLIVGDNSQLKTFENELNDSHYFKNAIDYYYKNRRNFSTKSRVKYIEDVLTYISSFTLYNNNVFTIESNVESIFDASIANVNIWGDNPIPEEARDLFKLAKSFYIESGEDLDWDIHLEEGDYRLTCIDKEYANKIRGLKFDKALLEGQYDGYINRQDEYVDVVFENREQVLEEIDSIVYPTILIKNLSQLNAFKKSSVWKANIVIVPEKVTFVPYGEEYYKPETLEKFENETLYSKDEETYIDYANYNLVVIPQQKTLNEKSLNNREINVTETGFEMAHTFTVLGILDDVKLIYTSNPFAEDVKPVEIYVGNITNEKVTVNVAMPTDFSGVVVEGLWFYGDGEFEIIKFSLDDARDPESYPLILKKINN